MCSVQFKKKSWKKDKARKKLTLTYKIYLNLQNNSHKKKRSCFRQFYNSRVPVNWETEKKRKETKRNGKKKNEKKTRRKVTKRNEKKRNAKKRKQNSEKRNETKEKEKKRKKRKETKRNEKYGSP